MPAPCDQLGCAKFDPAVPAVVAPVGAPAVAAMTGPAPAAETAAVEPDPVTHPVLASHDLCIQFHQFLI
jgi:hypothetical protein